jgi:hypothetical protein
MDETERESFLGSGGTGVISFSTDDDAAPYSVPVSYGYDATDQRFYFRLAFETDSTKWETIEDSPVSFVAYEQVDGSWQSVVATGQLTEISEPDVGPEALEGLRRVHIPLVEVFERPTREVQFRFFVLDPDDVTGRKEADERQ